MNNAAASVTLFVPVDGLSQLDRVFAPLARRAAKLGLPVPGYTLTGVQKPMFYSGANAAMLSAEVVITYPTVQLNGWSVAATLDYEQTTNPIIYTVLAGFSTAAYRTVPSTQCDHCNTARRRNLSYLVRHESGEVKVVGSSCLSDFVGGHDVAALVWCATLPAIVGGIVDECSMGGFGGSGSHVVGLRTFLNTVQCVAAINGFVSRKDARDMNLTATADGAFAACTQSKPAQELAKAMKASNVSPDAALTERVVAWILADTTNGDYMYTLKQIVETDYVTFRSAGVVASAFGALHRFTAARVKDREVPSTGHVGEIKGRLCMRARLLRTWDGQGDFGSYVGSVWQTEDGRKCTVFSSGYPRLEKIHADGVSIGYRAKIGGLYYVRGTPKKHDSYKGEPSTILGRLDVLTLPQQRHFAALDAKKAKAAAKKAAKLAAK
jgi:hypothetical protein